MDPRRLARLSEALREELDEILGYEMADPRIAVVSVADVHMSSDCRHARVMVNVPGAPEEQQAVLEALARAAGFVRHQLTERIDVFRIPDLRFELAAVVHAERVGQLLKRIRKGRSRDEKKPLE